MPALRFLNENAKRIPRLQGEAAYSPDGSWILGCNCLWPYQSWELTFIQQEIFHAESQSTNDGRPKNLRRSI